MQEIDTCWSYTNLHIILQENRKAPIHQFSESMAMVAAFL